LASNRVSVPAGTVLNPGDHYLFTNSGSSSYSDAVPGDQAYSTGFTDFAAGNHSGARLVNAKGGVIDGVGSPASLCREETDITTPTANGDNSFERKDGGRQDTNNNAADFVGPKTGSPQNLTGEGGNGPEITKIHTVQGPGAGSPIAERTVTVEPEIVEENVAP
jgi:hypothetical protein